MSEWEEHIASVFFRRAVNPNSVCLDHWDVEPNHRKWWLAETNLPWPHRKRWEVYTVLGTSVHGPVEEWWIGEWWVLLTHGVRYGGNRIRIL